MNELALFAGAGGGILGGSLLGWRTVCAVEIEPYAASVLVARQNDGILPPFPIWDDIRTFDGKPWRGLVDVVSGGFPCQPFSTAARGRNVAADLWPEMCRVIGQVNPSFVFAENVTQSPIEQAASDLESMGYRCKAIRLGAEELGAPHIRSRCWLFAYADDKGELLRRLNAEMGMRSNVSTSIWEGQPGSGRMVDGVANRVDRFKAIGNGQVPAVVRRAWRSLCQSSTAEGVRCV